VPCELVYFEQFEDKTEAMRREWEIKHKMTRAQKLDMIENNGGQK